MREAPAKFEVCIEEYQLDINEAKTRIISTNYVFGESWPSEFERDLLASLSPKVRNERSDGAVSTFGRIVDRAIRDNDDGIIKHAVRVMDEHHMWSFNWNIIEHFLAQCAVQFPHSFDYVARVVAWRIRTKQAIDRSLWLEIARTTALQSGKLGRDSEAAWAIWLMKELTQRISKELADALLGNCGALVLGFLAHFPKNRLMSDRQLYSRLRDVVDGDPFAGVWWALTLELSHLGEDDPKWRNSTTVGSLRALHEAKASMIDWNAPPKVFIREAPEDNGPEFPDYAIEDYASDYGDGSDNKYEGDDELQPFP